MDEFKEANGSRLDKREQFSLLSHQGVRITSDVCEPSHRRYA